MAQWNEADHPRRSAGSAGGHGGEFEDKPVAGDDADLADTLALDPWGPDADATATRRLTPVTPAGAPVAAGAEATGGLDADAWADLVAEAGAGRPVTLVHDAREARAVVAMPDGSFRDVSVDFRSKTPGAVWTMGDDGVWTRADGGPEPKTPKTTPPSPPSTPDPDAPDADAEHPRHTALAVMLVGLAGVLAGLSRMLGHGPRRRGRGRR